MSAVRPTWQSQKDPPRPGDDEVHIWSTALARTPEQLATLTECLADEDRERADRYRLIEARSDFIVARATLRSVLGRYLGVEPRRVVFRYGPQGKPFLASGKLHFNLTHSHGLALVALSRTVEVGVDVERIRPFNDLQFAERYFSPREVNFLKTVSQPERTEMFFHAWTRKEAFLKATGEGIALGLDRIEVELRLEEPARLVLLDGCPTRAAEWSLIHLQPAVGYVGALALMRRGMRVNCWSWLS